MKTGRRNGFTSLSGKEVLKAVLYYVVNTQLPEDKMFNVTAYFEDDNSVSVIINDEESIDN